MKIDSVLKPKQMAWVSGAVLAVLLLIVLTRSGAKASVQAPLPIVEVATVEQRDVPVYGEWIGTLTGLQKPSAQEYPSRPCVSLVLIQFHRIVAESVNQCGRAPRRWLKWLSWSESKRSHRRIS